MNFLDRQRMPHRRDLPELLHAATFTLFCRLIRLSADCRSKLRLTALTDCITQIFARDDDLKGFDLKLLDQNLFHDKLFSEHTLLLADAREC